MIYSLYFVLSKIIPIFAMRYTDLRQSNLTVELLVMGVIASSFFIHGPDPRDVCLMAALYLT